MKINTNTKNLSSVSYSINEYNGKSNVYTTINYSCIVNNCYFVGGSYGGRIIFHFLDTTTQNYQPNTGMFILFNKTENVLNILDNLGEIIETYNNVDYFEIRGDNGRGNYYVEICEVI